MRQRVRMGTPRAGEMVVKQARSGCISIYGWSQLIPVFFMLVWCISHGISICCCLLWLLQCKSLEMQGAGCLVGRGVFWRPQHTVVSSWALSLWNRSTHQYVQPPEILSKVDRHWWCPFKWTHRELLFGIRSPSILSLWTGSFWGFLVYCMSHPIPVCTYFKLFWKG